MGWYNACPRGDYDEPDGSNPAIAEGKTARARRNGAAERGVGGPGKSRKVRKERLSVLSPPRCGGLCQRPLARKSQRRSVSAGRNGRKTSAPGEWKRTGEADSVTVQHPPGKRVLSDKLLPKSMIVLTQYSR
jgi:hypothetical protein